MEVVDDDDAESRRCDSVAGDGDSWARVWRTGPVSSSDQRDTLVKTAHLERK